eukprot:TRINITY_DN720_c0_g2_i2.p1 TRINITY_DN720_c0_g2~~TRINITY_DN720_c0_g2_i2.p1  ORF type:complete len:131 (+),score=22.50 TRINITY_DN720_c0_g2_i2:330-722(+)
MREQWIRYGEGFFIVYSITSRGSFDKELTPLLHQLERVRDVDAINEIPVTLFGNKLDLVNQRQVTTEEGREMAKRLGSGFFEGSAKSFINIEESFFELVRTIRRKQGNTGDGPTTKPKTTKKGGGGCQLI